MLVKTGQWMAAESFKIAEISDFMRLKSRGSADFGQIVKSTKFLGACFFHKKN
jgi:hypothetical protein